jgi:hypothetical protein
MTAKEAKASPDWERIENDFRAGLLSVREIAVAQGVSHVAIGKRAKREGWTRDLAAKIKAKAEALVTSRTVTKEVTAERAVTDQALIEANAEVIATVRLNHRKDIGRARTLAMSLLDELTHQTGNTELYEKLAELLLDGSDEKDGAAETKRWQAFQAAMSLGGRTKVMKDLADTLHKLIGLEREAYGLVEAKKLELSGKDGKPLAARELTDEQLAAIAAGPLPNG